MRRQSISTLANNADAAALETARAALTAASGQAVVGGALVALSIQPATGEQLVAGDMVGFAYVPTAIAANGSITTRGWRRWAGGDFAIVAGAGMVTEAKTVPPGADRVISLPLAVSDSGGSASFACGVFMQSNGTLG